MCGIFGIILNNSNENIYKLVINGLTQLQNRGYDSAGISILKDDVINVYKYASTNEENALEKLEKLNLIKDNDKAIYSIMGHNRWATHGIKNDTNAHPHLSNDKKFSIVHNGIIENYNELKQQLIKNGYIFHSQTDTEVIVNLIEYNYNDSKKCKNIFEAIEQTIKELRGTYGLLIQSVYEPDKLFCVRPCPSHFELNSVYAPFIVRNVNDAVIG
jgi:glucosamine--fructose-6-phosphate aminotransferase (isomerizing)